MTWSKTVKATDTVNVLVQTLEAGLTQGEYLYRHCGCVTRRIISDFYLVSRADCRCSHTLCVWTGQSGVFCEETHRTTITHVNQSLNVQWPTVTGLPGLLSFSSLSSRSPEMPLSLDWSCTFILSLLLILHTELLKAKKRFVVMISTFLCPGTIMYYYF